MSQKLFVGEIAETHAFASQAVQDQRLHFAFRPLGEICDR